MTRRSVPEWIGATPDSKIPPRVRARVFERFDGVCQETRRKITPGDEWDCDHAVALVNGGEHRESNLRPVLRKAHRAKTAQDVAEKAKCDRVRKKHLSLHKPKSRLGSDKWKRKLDGTTVPK